MAFNFDNAREVNDIQTLTWNSKNEDGEFSLKEGDTLEGKIEQIKRDLGENHSNLYILRKADGDLIGVWGSTVLDNRLLAAGIGGVVRIVYQGTKPSSVKGRQPYRDYQVMLGEEEPEIDDDLD